MKKSRRLALFFAILVCLATACTKHRLVYLKFVAAQSPKEVQMGQSVNCKVKLLYPTADFQLEFLGFIRSEISTNHYRITAPTLLTSHGQTNVNAVAWQMDTTFSFNPNNRGQYVVDFCDDTQIYYSDTIIVR